MKRDSWLRRQAVQIVAQLPEDRDQAISVLAYARVIVEKFLGERDQDPDRLPVGSSPRRLAISIVKPDELPK
jgi:hypothetical protein